MKFNITIHYESIYFLSAEFNKTIVILFTTQKEKHLLQPSFYHLAENFIHNKSQNISIYFSLCNVAVYFDTVPTIFEYTFISRTRH